MTLHEMRATLRRHVGRVGPKPRRSRRVLAGAIGALLLAVPLPSCWRGPTTYPHAPEPEARVDLELVWRPQDQPRGTRVGAVEPLEKPLLSQDVARVAEFYRHNVPDGLLSPRPAIDETTPQAPPPPRRWGPGEWYEPHTWRGGPLAVAVYERSHPPAPCILVVAHHSGGRTGVFEWPIAEAPYGLRSHPVVLDAGAGLLLQVAKPSRQGARGFMVSDELAHRIYVARAPDWRPRVVMDAALLGSGFAIRGQSLDGGSVYVVSPVRHHRRDRSPVSLWHIDTRHLSVRLICRDESLSSRGLSDWKLLPSPDGAYLAFNWYAGFWPVIAPLRVVDCEAGRVYALTWRERGTRWYEDCALAWANGRPGRLFFHTCRGELWSIDVREACAAAAQAGD